MCDFGGDFGGVSGDGYSTPYNVMGMGDVQFPAVGGALGSGGSLSRSSGRNGGGIRGGAAGGERSHHSGGGQNSNELFHGNFSLNL